MPMEKTFDPAAAEARISAAWEKVKAGRAGANAKPGKPGFSIVIPPPNVTGALHMGHAFNNTLQDVLVRWHRMRGFDTLWQPGTDHAGIATQMVVERELAATNRRRTDFSRDEFTALVWEQKRKSRGNIRGQLDRLGCSCDWDREAFTMSGAPGAPAGEEGNFHDAVIRVFVDMYNKGLIYRGKRLVNWDPKFETAISDLEVEQIEVAGHMWHFKYPLAGGATYEYVERDAEGTVTFREMRDYISIATTRPETMLGDGAVAVHPSDERYAAIIGKLCEIPVGPKAHRRLIPIIADEYPDPNFGSGAVKITGAHDFNDYGVAQRNGIPLYRLMDTKAAMRADGLSFAESATVAGAVARGERTLTEAEADQINLVPDDLRGLDRYDARKAVVAAITAEGLAVMVPAPEGAEPAMIPLVEAKKIMQPHGDRSKVVIEPMLTDQWFVDTAKIVEPALEAVRTGRTRIMPPSGEKTYYHWLENIEPWCISRQLWWGHRIPVWYGPGIIAVDDSNSAFSYAPTDLLAFCGATFEEAKTNALAFYSGQINDLGYHVVTQALGKEIKFKGVEVDEFESAPDKLRTNARRGTLEFKRDPDVLDTWFSSGLWPIGTLGWPEQTDELKRYFPTSVLVTGQDILFFWVARMMMMQLAVVNDVPFRDVYLHGLVRDAKGKKMSKSLGNVIDPLEIIDQYGADALRFANVAMASLGGVLKLDTQRIAGYRNFGTKLWNACRFAELNGVWEGHATQSAPPAPTATVNRWILGETARTLRAVDEALETYRFDQAADALYRFVWGQVCDWYVEFAKPLFDGPLAQETRETMAFVLDRCMVMLHPMMPFITEELWATTGKRAKMLVHTDWPNLPDLTDTAADGEMAFVTRLIDEIRSARAQMHVPVGLKTTLVATHMDSAARAAWDRNATLIQRLARVETLSHADTAPRGSVAIALPGASFALPLEGIIDVAAEVDRLDKSLAKLGKEIAGLQGRLNNPNFAASAPEDVVEECRTNLALRQDEAAKLQAARDRLGELA